MTTSTHTAPVLVTGAGGPAGVSVIRSLMRAGETVVAADCDASAVGLRLSPSHAVLPRSDEPTFIEAVVELALSCDADAIISTVAEELVVLAAHSEVFDGVGLRSWFPPASAVEACVDKVAFARICEAVNLPVPQTSASGHDIRGPWIVKPRFGRGSRDVFAVDSEEDLDWICARVDDPIVQTRLVGREFTADGLVSRDGTLVGLVPRWRLETKAGISTKGETFLSDAVTSLVADTAAALGLTGPICLQGFIDDTGAASLIEVNPRFSGGLPLSLAAGCDLVGQYLRGIRGLALEPDRLTCRPGVTMLRYFEEVFEG